MMFYVVVKKMPKLFRFIAAVLWSSARGDVRRNVSRTVLKTNSREAFSINVGRPIAGVCLAFVTIWKIGGTEENKFGEWPEQKREKEFCEWERSASIPAAATHARRCRYSARLFVGCIYCSRRGFRRIEIADPSILRKSSRPNDGQLTDYQSSIFRSYFSLVRRPKTEVFVSHSRDRFPFLRKDSVEPLRACSLRFCFIPFLRFCPRNVSLCHVFEGDCS